MPAPPIRFIRKPPTKAPTIPRKVFFTHPELLYPIILLAIHPEIAPRTIQKIIFIFLHFLLKEMIYGSTIDPINKIRPVLLSLMTKKKG